MKLLKNISILFISFFMLSNCGDPVPTDYEETVLLEALLIVDSSIKNIRLTKTLPILETYYYGNALIKDATIFIYEEDNEMQLTFKEYDTAKIKQSGYYYNDTNYKIKPNTEYKLKAILSNGKEITGTTTTPNRIEWTKDIEYLIPYPDDTLNLPTYSGGQTEWSKNDNKNLFFIYSITCLDTLGYGKYLTPSTTEPNRRIRIRNNDNDNEPPRPSELSINSLVFLTNASFNWNFCRWFGKHSLKIYVPDKNYEQWFMYYLMTPNFNEKSYSINGAAGYFGSASAIGTNFFLQKNKYASEEK